MDELSLNLKITQGGTEPTQIRPNELYNDPTQTPK